MIILGYYNLGLIYVVLAIISVSYDNTVFVITKECDNIVQQGKKTQAVRCLHRL